MAELCIGLVLLNDSDYDSSDEYAREDEKERIENDKPRIGTGRVIPTKFIPPNPGRDTPQRLFAPGISAKDIPPPYEFIRRDGNRTQFLVYTDGACLSNGQPRPRAGCSFIFRPSSSEVRGNISFPSELEGPSGQQYAQTSNRAGLRAVLAALRFRW
ncbi:uncharacterized protein N7479_009522 [Penicillium vulpinum]|uniref:RNase H type-1 domain-containing protein n=1 Tax=Penicillium vulpinum TaxID=29845 RepID=A0A1V6RZA7_9EURO|nr:uncharacterized protein N7479_009522 [Penicillium vulpinum]KAJ5951109.1 hypothetical protein N7479_009522 [Penicillium vulpinum]OQE06814.1 hypothetical protein PENVUL_c016G04399 [Penicillium vulpinum]